MDQCQSMRQRKGVHNRRGNQSLWLHFRIGDIRKIVLIFKVLWCLQSCGVPTWFPWAVPFKWWKAPFERHPLSPLAQKQILQCDNQANELQLPHHWNQWKHWVIWKQPGAKCNHLPGFGDILVLLQWSWTAFLNLFSPQTQTGKLKLVIEDFTPF